MLPSTLPKDSNGAIVQKLSPGSGAQKFRIVPETATSGLSAWSDQATYAVDDMVTYANHVYICVAAITQASTEEPLYDKTHWHKITSIADPETVYAQSGAISSRFARVHCTVDAIFQHGAGTPGHFLQANVPNDIYLFTKYDASTEGQTPAWVDFKLVSTGGSNIGAGTITVAVDGATIAEVEIADNKTVTFASNAVKDAINATSKAYVASDKTTSVTSIFKITSVLPGKLSNGVTASITATCASLTITPNGDSFLSGGYSNFDSYITVAAVGENEGDCYISELGTY